VPPRGRLPLPRGVYSFEDQAWSPPEFIVLDTSIAIEAVLASQPHHAACLRLVEQLAEAGTRVLISDILLAEFAEGIYKVVLRERHGNRRWQRYWTDGRARRRAARLLAAALEDWQAMCTTLVWNAVALSEVSDWVEALMSAFGLHSYDAAHAGSALAAGADDLATLDRGFGRVSETVLTLHTVNDRLAGMRSRRPRTRR
jgi:predicted nucleic acid-binding protein